VITYPSSYGTLRSVRPAGGITEFGCTYAGAAARGGSGWLIIDEEADRPVIKGDHRRDEEEQVRYFRGLMEIYDDEQVDAAFWFSFAGFALPHRVDPKLDLDMASYGAVAWPIRKRPAQA
jgi:hypothetical protein